jgi:UDP-2,3-diacylglucosamine pyrophosphatase LpxH
MAGIAWLVPPPSVAMKPAGRGSAPAHGKPTRFHRTIFISDIHLGTRGCKAEYLVDFLQRNSCETLYLIGDIVDGWQLRRRWYWTEAHSRVVHEILHKVDSGTRVIFVPGNHDEFLRPYCGRTYAGIEVVHETVHETADGRKMLVLHGDQFDGVIAIAKWLAHLGSWAYDKALQVNEALHAIRRGLGLPYWSLSAWLKHAVKDAVEYVCRFEDVVAHAAEARGLDGVICGHIHQAQIRTIGNVQYHNDGDWVESCTALVEDARGHLEIVRWAAPQSASAYDGTIGQAAPVPA